LLELSDPSPSLLELGVRVVAFVGAGDGGLLEVRRPGEQGDQLGPALLCPRRESWQAGPHCPFPDSEAFERSLQPSPLQSLTPHKPFVSSVRQSAPFGTGSATPSP